LVLVGQISTAILVGLGLLWIPFMRFFSDQLYVYLQKVQAYISPPVAAVFLLGVFWKRVNAKGAIVSLVTGFIMGMGRLALELKKAAIEKPFGDSSEAVQEKMAAVKNVLGDGLIYQYTTMNFMHVAVFLTIICSAVLILVSLMTRPESDEQLAGLTFATTKKATGEMAVKMEGSTWQNSQIWLSIILVSIVAAIWIYFSG